MSLVIVVGSYAAALVMDVDRIPAEGETVMGRGYRVTHGGKGSNMACCAARTECCGPRPMAASKSPPCA